MTREEEILELSPEVERLVVLGDPHGDVIALDLLLEQEAGPETLIVSVGDNIGYCDGKISSYTCELLAARGIRSVMGNHEAWSLEGEVFLAPAGQPKELSEAALRWMRNLPMRIRVRSPLRPELTISITHTLPNWASLKAESVRQLLDLEDSQLVFCGHSHRPTIYNLGPRAKQAAARRFDPEAGQPLTRKLTKTTRLVIDAGSLARPNRPFRRLADGTFEGGELSLEFGTYAALDLAKGQVELCAIDKRPRLEQLMNQLMG